MRKLFLLLPLLWQFGAYAADTRITLTITITNAANCTNGTVLAIPAGASGRMATNLADYTSTTFVTNATAAGLKTNLFFHIAANPMGSPRYILRDISATSFALIAEKNQALTVSTPTNWADFTLSTNTVTSATGLRLPLSVEYATNANMLASEIVTGIDDYATNRFGSNSPALASYVSTGTNVQSVLGPKTFWQIAGNNTNTGNLYNGTNIGTRSVRNTNEWSSGTFTNPIIHTPVITNGANYGNAFRSPGGGAASEQFGDGATASTNYAIAVGAGAAASGIESIAMGLDTVSSGTNSTAIGSSSSATGNDATAIGRGASANYENSVAIGVNTAAGAAGDFILGNATNTVKINGILYVAVQTNSTWAGTNILTGDLSVPPFDVQSLANGNNLLAVADGKTMVTLSPGPTAAYSIHGISGGRSGRLLTLINTCSAVLTLGHENGFETTAANRIKTFNSADASITTNGVVTLFYDAGASRWRILNIYP